MAHSVVLVEGRTPEYGRIVGQLPV